MDLFEKKTKFDIKTLASNPLMYYGKIMLITLGAFAVGKAAGRRMNDSPDEMF